MDGSQIMNGKNLRNSLKMSLAIVMASTVLVAQPRTATAASMVPLAGHLPYTALALSQHIGQLESSARVPLSVGLKLRNQAELANLIARMQNPKDELYGHFLTPEQFTDRFAPSSEDVLKVTEYLQSKGLEIKNIHPNHLLIEVEGSAADVEKAFQVQLHQYRKVSGKVAFAPLSEPMLDAEIAPLLNGVVGINTFSEFHHHIRMAHANHPAGSAPQGGLGPSDLRSAYNLSSASQDGSGETLAVMELDGYTTSDISTYARQFGITKAPKLKNVLVSGATGEAGDGAVEVTLDLQVMIAIAPGASQILVYEGPNTDAGLLATYSKIATDNKAREISTSWGQPETQASSASLQSENTIFMQMASQGQSLFAASGDSGAYDDGSNISVDDPASQPYVTGVGGTSLTMGSGSSYGSESAWSAQADGENPASGGGGGISTIWSAPSYQAGLANSSNQGSTSMRMVPDVSLDANPTTGYGIYYQGQWGVVGGTSAAAPAWAAFAALVNQARLANSQAPLGLANPALYAIAKTSAYANDFHDIADGSTNLYYPAVTGYDMATGLGSFNGASLLSDLANATSTSNQ